ncbi:hypothetical protein CGCSCA4_v004846 [Colletotrichum siamense]|uniref:Uncharacterized protein n=1 Tax=Colletotrichum siamense TaxID=690259 RepID=A0A9P5F5G8_COLSI|nr:hypothetical protein CGCSCA4_v004846 [Colletotrichum siamense]KAF4866941.1 hypothetical protein CGCSCA2_v000225 [Colletotrichum siamense]
MANNNPAIKSEPGNEAWDEERLEQSLNQLKLLHTQLRGLRTTIPRMMDPLSAHQPTPKDKFASFIKSVEGARKEVQDFQDLRKSEEMTKIMNHASQRRREEPKGVKPWRATEHPDWTTLEPESS